MILKLTTNRAKIIELLEFLKPKIGNWQESTCVGYNAKVDYVYLLTHDDNVVNYAKDAFQFSELKTWDWLKLNNSGEIRAFTFIGDIGLIQRITISSR